MVVSNYHMWSNVLKKQAIYSDIRLKIKIYFIVIPYFHSWNGNIYSILSKAYASNIW